MSYVEAWVWSAGRVEVTQNALESACGREVCEEVGVLPERHAFAHTGCEEIWGAEMDKGYAPGSISCW